jgi:hypothetical protein
MKTETPLHLRIFISSPGDVGDERRLAREIIEALPRDPAYRGKITSEAVAYDDPDAPSPMPAGITPQLGVNLYKGPASACDLTLVILWSRLGTPVSADCLRSDGSRYESGTVSEYENALAAGKEVWIFRRSEKPRVELDDPDFDNKLLQYRAVGHFLERLNNADGSAAGGRHDYTNPAEFADLFRKLLSAYFTVRLDCLPDATPASEQPPAKAIEPPFLAPEVDRDHAIVGRDELLRQIWQRAIQGKNQSLLFLPGVGKTTVAQGLLADRPRLLEHFDGVLWADLGRQPLVGEQLRRWATALQVPDERKASLASIDDWKSTVKSAIGTRRLLVVLDDVWQIKAAREFMHLVTHGVFIVTTRCKDVAAMLGDSELVPELDPATGLTLLTEIAPKAVSFDRNAAQNLVGAVYGLPLALVLIGKYLRRESSDADPDRCAAAFQTMAEAGHRLEINADDEDSSQSLAEIIDVSFAALRSDAARQAILNLAIFRPKPNSFSKDIALQVADTEAAVLYDLSDIGLIEHCGNGEYTMHRVIAEYARTKLPLTVSQALHHKAVNYYARLLQQDIDDNPVAYLGWYRYEQTDWQATKDAWLYHLAHTGNAVSGVQAFLRVYFDAFWWWGYYQRFPFCERLLLEWQQQRSLDPKVQQGLDHLASFQAAYPEGYEKAARGNWPEVERSLSRLRQSLGLEGAITAIGDEDARRVRGFTDFLLAEAYAYGRHDHAGALKRYSAAHDIFHLDGDLWVAAWLCFYVAQYLLEQGDLTQSADYARRSLSEAGSAAGGEDAPLAERDSELLANDYRLLGDLAITGQQFELAAIHYCRATFYAYAFQAIPEPADTYTMAFYEEITCRIAEQVARLATTDRAAANALCRDLASYWQIYWQRHPQERNGNDCDVALSNADAAGIATALFPLPITGDILSGAADYAREVEAIIAPLTAALGNPAIYETDPVQT